MNKTLKQSLLLLISVLVFIYSSVFLAMLLNYSFLGLKSLSQEEVIPSHGFIWLSLVGLSLSLLASLCAWPFSLSIATLLEQNKSTRLARGLIYVLKFLGTLPLVVFAYLFVEVVGENVFELLEKLWIEIFTSSNLLTQALAFALTLLLYPLMIIPWSFERLSVDLFFKNMLSAVIEFAEVGLVSSVVILGLVIYILPQMVLRMLKYLQMDDSRSSYDVIQSIGGTRWESIYMTVLQSMKEHFNLIVVRFTRICFFEALITLSLLSFFFKNHVNPSESWGATLTSTFAGKSMVEEPQWNELLALAGGLFLIYLALILTENYFRRKVGGGHG